MRRGEAPDAGFEKSASTATATAGRVAGSAADSIATAREEIRAIVDLAMDLSKSLRMEDILSILAARLKQLVPYDCLAIYVRERSVLKAQYTNGLNSERFASLEIPVGQGLSGWVVENAQGDRQWQSGGGTGLPGRYRSTGARCTPRSPSRWAMEWNS